MRWTLDLNRRGSRHARSYSTLQGTRGFVNIGLYGVLRTTVESLHMYVDACTTTTDHNYNCHPKICRDTLRNVELLGVQIHTEFWNSHSAQKSIVRWRLTGAHFVGSGLTACGNSCEDEFKIAHTRLLSTTVTLLFCVISRFIFMPTVSST